MTDTSFMKFLGSHSCTDGARDLDRSFCQGVRHIDTREVPPNWQRRPQISKPKVDLSLFDQF